MRRRPEDLTAWLRQDPTLDELQPEFPKEWQQVRDQVARVSAHGDDHIKAYLLSATRPPQREPGRMKSQRVLLAGEVRRRMILESLRMANLTAETGVRDGPVRFNLLNGSVAQRLLFANGLERKPVSALAYRLLWPLLWQRRLLLPLVRPKGIYCFYSWTFALSADVR